MDEKHREIAEDLFSKISMTMTQVGHAIPIYIMILEDGQVFPIIIEQQVDLQQYASIATNIASEYNAEAMMLICEQYMVSRVKGDHDLQDLLSGKIRASEHPDKKEYLTLIYLNKNSICESMLAEIHRDIAGTPFTRDFKWVNDAISSALVPWW